MMRNLDAVSKMEIHTPRILACQTSFAEVPSGAFDF